MLFGEEFEKGIADRILPHGILSKPKDREGDRCSHPATGVI
jgi:hypothetical protein